MLTQGIDASESSSLAHQVRERSDLACDSDIRIVGEGIASYLEVRRPF